MAEYGAADSNEITGTGAQKHGANVFYPLLADILNSGLHSEGMIPVADGMRFFPMPGANGALPWVAGRI